MRWLVVVSAMLAVLLMSGWARAQSDAKSDKAADIKLDELAGITLSGEIVYAGRGRWSGDNVVRPYHQTWQFNIQLGKETSIKWTLVVHMKRGEKARTTHFSHSATINRPDTKSEVIGARAVVWTYEDNALTLLRVFDRGGRTVKMMLVRTELGMSCVAHGAYFQEVGKGNPMHKAANGRGYLELIGVKQVSSSCRVRRAS